MLQVSRSLINANWCVLDGAPGGWVACTIQNDQPILTFYSDLSDDSLYSFDYIFIDMPVHLPTKISNYPRQSDIQAKKYLSRFHSSVFYAPLKQWLNMHYDKINVECDSHQKPKLSKQSFHLFTKIIEVQELSNNYPNVVLEIHPELLIHYFIGASKQSKKSREGVVQRLDILQQVCCSQLTVHDLDNSRSQLRQEFSATRVGLDDMVDALFVSYVIKTFNIICALDHNGIIENHELWNRFNLFKNS